jgi:nucleoside-diphosphate-sugar epimerase
LVLVTGGTGFLGRGLVRRLIEAGARVRVLTRRVSNGDALAAIGAEIRRGDVADASSFDAAMAGVEAVVHLAAGTSGSEKDSQQATLHGTRNVLDLTRKHRPSRLVYISSCSVYGAADHAPNATVDEAAPLERFPERRGHYSASKLEAERMVTAEAASGGVPTVVLRPGTIYGPGGDLFPPIIGFARGSTYVVLGRGSFVLPYVYVENMVEAIVRSLDHPDAAGQIFNVVDPERLTKRAYVDRVIRRVDPGARVVYLPLTLFYGIVALQETAFAFLKRRPVLTRYRVTSSQRCIVYDSRRITSRLGWAPVVPLAEALDRLVAFEQERRRANPFVSSPHGMTGVSAPRPQETVTKV